MPQASIIEDPHVDEGLGVLLKMGKNGLQVVRPAEEGIGICVADELQIFAALSEKIFDDFTVVIDDPLQIFDGPALQRGREGRIPDEKDQDEGD